MTANIVPTLEVKALAPETENPIFTARHFIVASAACMLLYMGSLTISEVLIIIALSYFIGLFYYAKGVANVGSRH